MSEFILNTEGAGAPWKSLSTFTQGFIEAAFFCETSNHDASEFFGEAEQLAMQEGQTDGNIPSDSSVAEIDAESFVRIKNFCDEFQARNAALLESAYERDDYSEEQAGRDLYYTHAGHGTGFWCREQLEESGLDQALSEAAGRGEIHVSAYQSDKHESGFLIEFHIS